MPNVLISNDDITVLGPPEVVELLVDIGPKGDRGSQVYIGSGNPNALMSGSTIFGKEVLLNDLYINTSPGESYAYLYQYIAQPGGNSWVETLKINPTIYSKAFLTTYSDGVGQIVIPISDIVTSSGTPLTAANFNVQYSIAHDNPVASSMMIPALDIDSGPGGDNLIINLKAVEYVSGTWQDLDEGVTTHIFITIVNVDEES
jgi:hypothetical protein